MPREWIECEGLPRKICNKYRARHGHDPLPTPQRINVQQRETVHKKKPIPSGPGTELKRQLADLGARPSLGCGCDAKIERMNEWGVDGCLEHIDEIAGWLKSAAASQSKSQRWASAWAWVKTATFAELLDPYRAMVRRACDAAREKTA